MTPLRRAVALKEMHDMAVRIREHLNLDVTRAVDEPLDVQRSLAERRLRLTARGLHCLVDRARIDDATHALAAAAGRRLHDRR